MPVQNQISNIHVVFYLCQSDKKYFTFGPVDVNTIGRVIATMCSKAGQPGVRSNNIFTSTTMMYIAGMEEQPVQENAGHDSNAVRDHKQTSKHMHRLKGEILYEPK